jgi:uncharacterized protein YggE
MNALRILVLVVAAAAVVALSGVGRPEQAGGAAKPSAGITVNGTGTIEAVPDEATFSLGLESKGGTAREAISSNSQAMRYVIAAVRHAGVAKDDIQTQAVSISQSYDNDGHVDGYSASNTVSVTIRELARAGTVLDAATRAGANNVYGPTLERSNREQLQAKALEDAFANARSKAKALAAASGLQLGEVTAIAEGADGGSPMPYYSDSLMKRSADAPIEPGQQEIRATVTVTFAVG